MRKKTGKIVFSYLSATTNEKKWTKENSKKIWISNEKCKKKQYSTHISFYWFKTFQCNRDTLEWNVMANCMQSYQYN